MADGSGEVTGPGTKPRLAVLRAGIVAEAERLDVPVTLSALCDSAVTSLGVVAVAVSVAGAGDGTDTLAASGRLARAGEELQVTAGEGPSLEALSRPGPLLVEDLASADCQARWPLFAPAGVEAGIGALCAVPMRVGAARFAVFAAYLDRPGRLGPAAFNDAVHFTALALELLLDHLAASISAGYRARHAAAAGWAGPRSVDGRVFDDRPEIHQATGMISLQLGVDLPTALLRIRARAFTDGRLLSDVAADVVARTLRFTADPDEETRPP